VRGAERGGGGRTGSEFVVFEDVVGSEFGGVDALETEDLDCGAREAALGGGGGSFHEEYYWFF
jgi:hypothetical protein